MAESPKASKTSAKTVAKTSAPEPDFDPPLRRAPGFTRGFWRLNDCAAPLLKPAFERRGFAEARIFADWPTIVGVRLARLCRPVKIARQGGRSQTEGGTLVVGARSGAAMELTHAAPQIVERVNSFYGYRAVDRLRVDQTLAPLAPPAPQPSPPPEAPPPLEAPLEALESIDDPGLRAALERLARNRAATSSSSPRKAP